MSARAATFSADDVAALAGGPAQAATVNGTPPDPAHVFPLLSVADLAKIQPPTFLLGGILPAGGFSVLFGPSGAGKSFLALDWSLCIASGRPWYGNDTRPGWVLYIAAEGRAGLGVRVQAWQQARRQPTVERIRFLPDAVNFLDETQLGKARRTLAGLGQPPALIVVDTMARSMAGGEENSARDVGMFIAAVDKLRRGNGAAALIVHHTGKNGEDERGSSALRGAADLMAALKPDGAGLRLECIKAKDSEPFEPWNLHLEPFADSCLLRPGSNQAAMSDAERQILESLSAGFGSDRVSTSTLQRASGVPERSYFRALKSLDDKGYVHREPQGRSTLIALSDHGAAQLLPTAANPCQADVSTTAATTPSLGVAGDSAADGSPTTGATT
ncbi:MAG: AAA family ATPase [Thermoleophilia bacterium]